MADVVFTDQNFAQDVEKATMPVLVDFWAPWCGPCKIISPLIEELSKSYEGKMKVGKMNVDENPTVPGKFSIMGIPTVMIFKGGKPVKTLVGAQNRETYKAAIEEAIK